MKKWFLSAFLAFGLIAPAHAVIYGHGDKSIRVHDLPNLEVLKKGSDYVDVGYCYKQLHILWLPVWNWDERYCGYLNETTYAPNLTREAILEVSKEMNWDTSWDDGKSKIPFWERVGGKIALGGLLIAWIAFNQYQRRKKEEENE